MRGAECGWKGLRLVDVTLNWFSAGWYDIKMHFGVVVLFRLHNRTVLDAMQRRNKTSPSNSGSGRNLYRQCQDYVEIKEKKKLTFRQCENCYDVSHSLHETRQTAVSPLLVGGATLGKTSVVRCREREQLREWLCGKVEMGSDLICS